MSHSTPIPVARVCSSALNQRPSVLEDALIQDRLAHEAPVMDTLLQLDRLPRTPSYRWNQSHFPSTSPKSSSHPRLKVDTHRLNNESKMLVEEEALFSRILNVISLRCLM